MKRILVGTLGVALTFAAACSNSGDLTMPGSDLQLTAADTSEAAAISAGDATAEDVDMFAATEGSMDLASASFNLVPVGAATATTAGGADSTRFAFWSFSRNCAFSATTGRFTCPDVTHNGLTLSSSAAFYDANGAAMPHYNDTTTASANFQLAVAGVHVAPEGADTISRTRNMTVSNLLGHETARLWNGAGSRNDAGYRTDTARTRTYRTADTVTFTNVAVSLPRSTHPWPMSGTVARRINGTGTVVRSGVTRTFSVSKTATITFNGTRFVPMVVGTTTFTLDLYTGRVVKS